MVSDSLFCIVITLAALASFEIGYQWAARLFFKKWKEGFNQGYNMGKEHGQNLERLSINK